MGSNSLNNIQITSNPISYMASVEGILRGAGWWNDESYKLMGMTGMAFHFYIHSRVYDCSVKVYDWEKTHLKMIDRIGIYSETVNIFTDGLQTVREVQQEAVRRIKASIDRGIGVVLWGNIEFWIVDGYDDEDQVFFVQSNIFSDPDPVLYHNLGKSEIPYLFYQIFKQKVEVDYEQVYRESLLYGLQEWNKEIHVDGFASGRKAYDYLIAALENHEYDERGLAYVFRVYNYSKDCIYKYLSWIDDNSKNIVKLKKIVECYKEITDIFQRLEQINPFQSVASRLKIEFLPEVIQLVKEAKALEDEAMTRMEQLIY